MRLCSWRWQMAACNRCCASFSECWCGFCSDVGVSRRLVGLGSSPPHPPFVFRRNGRALDAAGGLENLLYFDANPSKVSLGIFGWFGGNFVQRPERHYQAGQTWLAREKSREAEFDCAKGFSGVKISYNFMMMVVWKIGMWKGSVPVTFKGEKSLTTNLESQDSWKMPPAGDVPLPRRRVDFPASWRLQQPGAFWHSLGMFSRCTWQ